MAARPRTPIKNAADPRGQLGLFLRSWFEANPHATEKAMGDAIGVSDRAVRKWCEGASSPSVRDLDKLAKFVGLPNWAELAAASVTAAKKERRKK